MFKYLLLILLLSDTAISYAAVKSSVYDLPKVVALQNRNNYLNKGITFHAGLLPSDAFNKGLTLGTSYTHFFSDFIAWEVANVSANFNIETNLKKDLVENFPVEIENVGFEGRLDYPQVLITSNLVYTPLYNKNLFFNKSVVNGETSFLAGGGTVKFKSTGFKPLIDFGLIQRYFLSPSSSLKFDFRINFYLDKDTGIQNFFSMNAGYAFQIGDAPKHIREER